MDTCVFLTFLTFVLRCAVASILHFLVLVLVLGIGVLLLVYMYVCV